MREKKVMRTVFIFVLFGLCFGLAIISGGCGGGDSTPPPSDGDSIPAAPSNLQATALSAHQIDLSWIDNSSNESSFKIERKTGASGSWTQIATVGANVTAYQNLELTVVTTYYYQVRAYNDAGHSGYSNEASATSLAGAEFTLGSDTVLITETIGVDGGTLQGLAGSELEGVVVDFSPGAISEDTEISLGYNDGTLTPAVGDASDLIISLTSSGTTTFQQPITITVPFTQQGNILVPYLIDDDGKIHVMTLTQIDRQNNTATFQTFHTSLFTWILEMLGLDEDPDSYATEYLPSEDGFQAVNIGSVYNRGGECIGMTSFSLWYFMHHLPMGNLYPKYMTVVGQDSDGNSLVGQNIIATRSFISINQQWNTYLPAVIVQQNLTEQEQFTVICRALLNTANPVLIYLYHDQPPGVGAHSVLAYAYDDNDVSIYDPNHPNSAITMTYNTENNFWDNYSVYDGIIYHGDGSLNLTEPYTNILTYAENDFHSSADAIITITSHSSGDDVPECNPTLLGTIASGQVLVTELEVFVGSTSFLTNVDISGLFDVDISLNQGVNHLQFITRGNDADGDLIVLPNDKLLDDFVLNGKGIIGHWEVTLISAEDSSDIETYSLEINEDGRICKDIYDDDEWGTWTLIGKNIELKFRENGADEDVTLTGTVNDECNEMSGTWVEPDYPNPEDWPWGTWDAIKISNTPWNTIRNWKNTDPGIPNDVKKRRVGLKRQSSVLFLSVV